MSNTSNDLVKSALVSYLRKRGKSAAQAEALATANLAAAAAYLKSRIDGFEPSDKAEEERVKHYRSYVEGCAYRDLQTWSESL